MSDISVPAGSLPIFVEVEEADKGHPSPHFGGFGRS